MVEASLSGSCERTSTIAKKMKTFVSATTFHVTDVDFSLRFHTDVLGFSERFRFCAWQQGDGLGAVVDESGRFQRHAAARSGTQRPGWRGGCWRAGSGDESVLSVGVAARCWGFSFKLTRPQRSGSSHQRSDSSYSKSVSSDKRSGSSDRRIDS